MQVNHVWPRSQDVGAYTALPNLCLTPAFLAKLTDKDDTIRSLLRYRSYALFGYWPDSATPVVKPDLYERLAWADPLPAVDSVEKTLRGAMLSKRKDRVVKCARELGWLFSAFQPDPTL